MSAIIGLALVFIGVIGLSATRFVRRAEVRGDFSNPESYRMSGPLLRRGKNGGPPEAYSRRVIKDHVIAK